MLYSITDHASSYSFFSPHLLSVGSSEYFIIYTPKHFVITLKANSTCKLIRRLSGKGGSLVCFEAIFLTTAAIYGLFESQLKPLPLNVQFSGLTSRPKFDYSLNNLSKLLLFVFLTETGGVLIDYN